MSIPLILTFTGPDRPGIVRLLARLVADHGGNWEESRSASLAGRFAGILKVTLAEERVEAFSAALAALGAEGLRVLVERGELGAPVPGLRRLRLELTGADHEGIVRDVAHVLAEHGVNIDELSTEHTSAPMSGDALFTAVALSDCPSTVRASELRRALEQLADDLVVSIALQETGGESES
jgi:glycine cleavage system regulatory protein